MAKYDDDQLVCLKFKKKMEMYFSDPIRYDFDTLEKIRLFSLNYHDLYDFEQLFRQLIEVESEKELEKELGHYPSNKEIDTLTLLKLEKFRSE